MTVIGKSESGQYICAVSHQEIEKFLNLYYGKKSELKVGELVNLGQGYDYASQIQTALDATQKFISANQQTVKAILNGFSLAELRKIKAVKNES